MVLRYARGRVGSRLFKPAGPAKEGYACLEVDILCLEVGVGIRFTARIRSGAGL